LAYLGGLAKNLVQGELKSRSTASLLPWLRCAILSVGSTGGSRQ